MGTVLGLAELRRCGWGDALVPILPGSKRPGANGTDAIGWQTKSWSPAELAAAEARGCSFGVRFNLISAAALDCDAEGGCSDAALVVAEVARRVIGEGVRRARAGTTRFAIAYRTATIGDGKRTARFQRNGESFSLELFSGSGQLLFGPRHSSGAEFVWDTLPNYPQLPVVTIDAPRLFSEIEAALSPLGYTMAGTSHFGITEACERDGTKRIDDPMWQALVAKRAILFEQRDGQAAIRCPFEVEHESGKGKPLTRDSSTAYLPPPIDSVTGSGHIKCLHATCAYRTQADYAAALGVALAAEPVLVFPGSPIPEIPVSKGGPVETGSIPKSPSFHIPTLSGFKQVVPPEQARRPRPMAKEAFRGPFGEAADLFAGCSEASRESLLLQTLAVFSAVPDLAGVGIGRRRLTGGALQVLMIGPTAQGRKGTSLAFALDLLEEAFPAFVLGVKPNAEAMTMPAPSRMLFGLSSGEGIVNAIRDSRQQGKDIDPGSEDKRLCVILEEFSGLLKAARRDGNTLSEILRSIHDGAPLQFPTKHDPLFASRSHVSAVAHCTAVELKGKVDAIDLMNGALNRWLIAYTERARVVADPPDPDEKAQGSIANTLRARLAPYAYQPGKVWHRIAFPLTPSAAALWRDELYPKLDAGEHGGTAKALTARYTAQAKRLALLYALGDGGKTIGIEHLRAAAAVLAYCQESLQYVFGSDSYPDTVTQRIADIVREARGTYVPRAALWKGLSHT